MTFYIFDYFQETIHNESGSGQVSKVEVIRIQTLVYFYFMFYISVSEICL